MRKRRSPTAKPALRIGARVVWRNVPILLAECEDRFNSGDPQGLLDGLRLLSREGFLPQWVAEAYLAAHARHEAGETLDAAFEFKTKKGEHRFGRELWGKRDDIRLRIGQLRAEGMPVSKTFARVGAELKLSESTVRKVYYAAQSHGRDYLKRLAFAALKRQYFPRKP